MSVVPSRTPRRRSRGGSTEDRGPSVSVTSVPPFPVREQVCLSTHVPEVDYQTPTPDPVPTLSRVRTSPPLVCRGSPGPYTWVLPLSSVVDLGSSPSPRGGPV